MTKEQKSAFSEADQGATSPEDIAQIKQSIPVRSDATLQNAVVVKIGSSEDLNARAQDFVNQLVS